MVTYLLAAAAENPYGIRAALEEGGIIAIATFSILGYDPETGEPLGVPGLGMSGVVWSMIVHHVYGVQEDYRTIRVPEGAAGRSLTLGKLALRYPGEHSVEITSSFDRDLRVVFARGTEHELRVTRDEATWPADVGENEVRFTARGGETYRVERQTTRP